MTTRRLTPEQVEQANAYFRQQWLSLLTLGLIPEPEKLPFLTLGCDPKPEAEPELDPEAEAAAEREIEDPEADIG